MLSYCTDYLAKVPDIPICINCDTYLAINLKAFDLDDNDEFIFTIKNYNYSDSSYIFMHRASKKDVDNKDEIIIKVPSTASKHLKPGAFYNFAAMTNVFDTTNETSYKKLTEDGKIRIVYGAQDLIVKNTQGDNTFEVVSMRLESIDQEGAENV